MAHVAWLAAQVRILTKRLDTLEKEKENWSVGKRRRLCLEELLGFPLDFFEARDPNLIENIPLDTPDLHDNYQFAETHEFEAESCQTPAVVCIEALASDRPLELLENIRACMIKDWDTSLLLRGTRDLALRRDLMATCQDTRSAVYEEVTSLLRWWEMGEDEEDRFALSCDIYSGLEERIDERVPEGVLASTEVDLTVADTLQCFAETLQTVFLNNGEATHESFIRRRDAGLPWTSLLVALRGPDANDGEG